MQFPVSLEINTPTLRVVPILAQVLRSLGNGWNARMSRDDVVWRPRPIVTDPIPLEWRLLPLDGGERSRLDIDRLDPGADDEPLLILVRNVRDALAARGLAVAAVVGAGEPLPLPLPPDVAPASPLPTPEPPSKGALFVAPRRAPFEVLARLMEKPLARRGYRLEHVEPGEQVVGSLRAAVAEADFVLGAWDTLPGRAALFQRWAQGRAAVALASSADAGEEWPGTMVTYGTSKSAFLHTLDTALAQFLDDVEQIDVPPPAPPSEDGFGITLPGRPLEAERQRIYRQVALDTEAPPEQRFHAARVLSRSGDVPTAAQVLAELVLMADSGGIAEEALEALGALGDEALPDLWKLDARAQPPTLAVEIARQLTRAGDPHTALFRLVRLAQHRSERVRLAALEALGEIDGDAVPHWSSLAAHADEPRVRLEAARWLQRNGHGSATVRATAVELAGQAAHPDIATVAVSLLEPLEDESSREALLLIAHHSPSAEARLAAAEILTHHGDVSTARSILLRLAQGSDDLAAGAALDMLVNVSDEAIDDTARLMNTASLTSVRRRAAELLSQPYQPEAIQQAAARVLLALERPALARPVLGRLARQAEDLELRRWAARRLAEIGEPALEELRQAFAAVDDPVVGQHLAEGLLTSSALPDDRRLAAIWLAEHSNLPRAVEVLGEIANSARVSGSDAVKATNDLNRYAGNWAGAARVLAKIASESPHPSARARALDLLLREHPSELPLSMLVDLAVTGSIGTADRYPVMQQLAVLATPAAGRIAARLADTDIDTDRRFQLLQLMNELPEGAVTSALLQLSARAPQDRIRYVASEQLLARDQHHAGFASLAMIAINGADPMLRERALYVLAQSPEQTEGLMHSVVDRTPFDDTRALAAYLLQHRGGAIVGRSNGIVDALWLVWDRFVASLPLDWIDRLAARRGPR